MLYHIVRILCIVKSMACKHIKLAGLLAGTHEVIDEEVVELVWSHEVFCLLLYVAVLVCGN